MAKIASWALFEAHPSTNPPFNITLGVDNEGSSMEYKVVDCQHIPDGIDKLKKFCSDNNFTIKDGFTLLYPIYMDAMNTEHESTMMNIAWIIKDNADANSWNFDRTGGLTGRIAKDFY